VLSEKAYIPVLTRVGTTLVVVGALDIASMIYCIANGISYSSSFNLFAVIAGIFLRKGSLRAASIVRSFGAFSFAALSSLVLAWPFLQPLDLTLTQLRLQPISFLFNLLFIVLILGVLYWVVNELVRRPVLSAQGKGTDKLRPLILPALIGLTLVVGVAVITHVSLTGDASERAKEMAAKQLDGGYAYYVSSMHFTKSSNGASYSAIVTAWNKDSIQKVSVRWEEK
jgi:hypothetical protein